MITLKSEIKHHDWDSKKEWRCNYVFIILALNKDEYSDSLSGRFTLGERAPRPYGRKLGEH
jgi:hypothetical protein